MFLLLTLMIYYKQSFIKKNNGKLSGFVNSVHCRVVAALNVVWTTGDHRPGQVPAGGINLSMNTYLYTIYTQ